jgi:translocation and assembly module TamB
LGGFITYSQGLGFNLTATGKELRLRYPPGVSTVANANLALTGNAQNSLLSGEVTITRFGINPQFDFGPYLMRAKQSAGAATPESPLSKLRLDVHVASAPELQVETTVGKISGDIDLRLRGTAVRPVVLGRVSIVEGEVSLYGTRYHLQRGDITFASPVGMDPVLDIQATANVRNYDITLGFHGPMNKMSTTYRSDPPLATADIVSLLAFGRTREETALQSSSNQSLPETASYAILNQALTAAISNRAQKIFGVSRIKIDPQMQNAAGLQYSGVGPTVTIEQQVANRLTVTYISNLSSANYQNIQAEYNVNRNVSIVANRDWNGILSFDIRIRQRKR